MTANVGNDFRISGDQDTQNIVNYNTVSQPEFTITKDNIALLPLNNDPINDHNEKLENGNSQPEMSTSSRVSPSAVVPGNTSFQSYSSRWYVLILYALLGIAANTISSTMSPIALTAESALNLTQTDISFLANWFYIMFIVGVFPYMWLIEKKGLRKPVISGAAFLAIGSFVRCLNTGGMFPMLDKILLHLGQAINGLASSVFWFACTKLSAVWFPSSERTISTSIGLMSGGFGVSISFLVGPNTVAALASKFADGREPATENYALAIRFLLYIECAISGLLCALALIYFPSEPPTPPSYSATSERFELRKGLLQFARSLDCWLILVLYSVSGAAYNGTAQFLAITIQDVMNDVQTGWLGFATTVAMVIAAPITSLTAKWWFHRRPKLICAAIMFVGASFTVIFLVAEAFVRSILSPALCWGTLVAGAWFITACQPIWWEMACEAAFPIPEQVISGIFALGYTSVSVLYILFYSFPSFGYQWPNWCLAIGECACVPIILFCSGKTRRSADDQRAEDEMQIDINVG